jgi:hypothetical protein
MRNARTALCLLLGAAMAAGAVEAAPLRQTDASRIKAPSTAMDDYFPAIDGPMSTVQAPDGSLWRVWSYRASGEFDIAVSSRDAAGVWSAPAFVGRRDGVDQQDPALAIGADGTLYLAFDTKVPTGVSLAILPAGSTTWAQPKPVSTDPTAVSPALLMVGGRLIVAFRTSRGVSIVDMPALAPQASTRGIQDGPDTVDPLGMSGPGLSSAPPPAGGGNRSGNGTGSGSGGGEGGGGKHPK